MLRTKELLRVRTVARAAELLRHCQLQAKVTGLDLSITPRSGSKGGRRVLRASDARQSRSSIAGQTSLRTLTLFNVTSDLQKVLGIVRATGERNIVRAANDCMGNGGRERDQASALFYVGDCQMMSVDSPPSLAADQEPSHVFAPIQSITAPKA